MNCPYSPINPANQIKVFISSAQRSENGFDWGKVREEIKTQLEACPYLNPFIIDAVASETSSTQLFQYEVSRTDIIVILVKGTVRPGTFAEFTTAIKNKKPLLLYFLKDDNPSLEVIQLRKAVQSVDYCTYRYMDSFDNIADVVRTDVIANVVRYYQYSHFITKETDTVPVEATSVAEEFVSSKHGTPTKSSIALFSSSYLHIYELLGIDSPFDEAVDVAPLHELGIAALDWLVSGTALDCDSEIINLIKNLDELYDSTDWLLKRWDAIRLELSGEYEKALESEKEALSLAKAANLPSWIVNDILIDCRNIENEIHNQRRSWSVENDFQKELRDLETIVYLPVMDRYLAEIYRALANEEFKFQTASPNTTFFGTNLGPIVNNVENYFFSALMYGSYTHMAISREILARVLYKYYDFTKERIFLFNCIKVLVVSGDTAQFNKTIDYKWDDVYADIASHADEIWHLTDFAAPTRKPAIKQAVITKLGLYLSDSSFEEMHMFLENYATNIYWGNSQAYFEAISQNMCRLNCTRVMQMLTGIIDERRFHIGTKLASIILQMQLDDVSVETQIKFCEALKDKIPFIVKNGGTPQIIAALVKQRPEIFSVLSTLPENGLTGIEKAFYEINVGEGDWNEVLNHEVETARKQFEVNRNPGTYTSFWELPYATIKKIVREHYCPSMNEVIVSKFFPLCIEVLASQTVAQIKNDCLDCLCDILVFNTNLKTKMPQELYETISEIDASKVDTVLEDSMGAFACRVLMVKIISGVANKEELLEWCVGYSKKETNERIALAECIEQFIVQGLPISQIDATILSIVMQCFDDEHYAVRMRACNCFALLLNTKYVGIVERKLCEAAIDPSHYVRNQVLKLCINGKINAPEIRNELFDILKNDANYAIRVGCK